MKSMKKRFLGILLSFAMMLTMVPALGLTQMAYAEPGPTTYPIWISGTQVTADNLSGDGWVYTPATSSDSPAVLSLNGYNNKGAVGGKAAGIFAEGNLVIVTSGTNTVSNASTAGGNRAIYVGGDLTLKGNGTLNAVGGNRTITVNNITVESGTVKTSDGDFGITAGSEEEGGDVIIKNGTVDIYGATRGILSYNVLTVENGTLIAKSSDEGIAINTAGDVTVESGKVETTGAGGIGSAGNVTINGGTVKATTTTTGIFAHGAMTINNGTVETTANAVGTMALLVYRGDFIINNGNVESTANGINSAGLVVSRGDAIIKGGKLTVSGKDIAIFAHSVKNSINGTAWTDPAGTEGETAIEINPDGQNLMDYKKVQFPAKAKPSPAKTGTLVTKMIANGKNSLNISWNKVQGADGYDIFFAPCNKNEKKSVCKNVKSMKGNNAISWTKSGLKKGTAYKAYVKAYVMENGQKKYISTSPQAHAYAGGYTKRFTNAKSVTVKKAKVSLKKGKTYKIKAKVKKLRTSKRLMTNTHAAKLRYMTSDAKVATVSKSGKITAKGKGQCTITVLAHNGVSKQVKVTVK